MHEIENLSVKLFFQSKIKRKKAKWNSKSEDEGFESPISPPLSPVNHQPDSLDFPKAPLANEEDLEEVEKYETEVTKEKDAIEPKKEISVSDEFCVLFYTTE